MRWSWEASFADISSRTYSPYKTFWWTLIQRFRVSVPVRSLHSRVLFWLKVSSSELLHHECGIFVSAAYFFLVNVTGCSSEFHVTFKHFQNLEKRTLKVLKEKLHISCLVNLKNCTVQTVTISKTVIKFSSDFHIQILWYSFTLLEK